LKFNQEMQFNETSADLLNDDTETNPEKKPFDISYKQGYPEGEEGFDKNKLNKWKVERAEGMEMDVQLFFSDPLWVSGSPLPCFIHINFGDSRSFINKGFGIPLDRKNRLLTKRLGKLLPKDGASQALGAAAGGLTTGTATAAVGALAGQLIGGGLSGA